MRGVIKWGGLVPIKCDICNRGFGPTDEHFYDFKTFWGLWAIGCEKCFEKVGCGLGTGFGQKFNLMTREKVEG